MESIIRKIANDNNACGDAQEWLKTNASRSDKWLWENCSRGDWMIWGLQKAFIPIEQKTWVEIAIHSAESCLPIYEKWNPKDQRPRQAIEVAKKLLVNPTEENKRAADAAAHAAADAAADAAAHAADAAADAAAFAAAFAADAAAHAADAAADAAAAADADFIREKIAWNKIVKLFKKGKQNGY